MCIISILYILLRGMLLENFCLILRQLILVLLRHRLSHFTIMSCFYFYQLIWLDVVEMTSLRDSSYFAPYSLLVRQSQAIFLEVKW